MRVVMVKGQSQYGGTRLFIDHAATAFRKMGWDADVVDLATGESISSLIHAAARRPTDLLFTINYLGEFRDQTGRTMSELFRAPHVLWHTDYILSEAARVIATARATALLVVDPTQVDAISAILGEDRFAHVGFFPHPAVGEQAPAEADAEAFARTRPIPLLWSGSLQKPGARPWADMPAPTREIFDGAFDLAMSVEWIPPHEALDAVLNAVGFDLQDPQSVSVRMAAHVVDKEVRVTRRYQFLKALAATGLPVHICGHGWESELHRFPNAIYEGPVEMSRMTELMRRARVVLNTNGNFGAGSHERPFSGFLAGAAVFSDYSQYYAQAFAADEIAMFRWTALDEGLQTLAGLVEAPDEAFRRASKGQARVLAAHTWERRMPAILDAAARLKEQTSPWG
jgi:hypothetical protein